MRNALEIMLNLQKDLEKLFYTPSSLSSSEKEKWTKEHILAVLAECGELLETFNWKHWKKRREEVNREKILKEFIDLLHFVLAIAVVWGFGATEILDAYCIKNLENFRRQKEGY